MPSPRDEASRLYRRFRPRPDPLGAPFRRLPRWAEPLAAVERSAGLFEHVAVSSGAAGVNLLLPSINADSLSAGPMTALRFGGALADALGRPYRLITSGPWGTAPDAGARLRDRLGRPKLAIAATGTGQVAAATGDDLWVATHWTTAFALDVAARAGVVDPSRVVYLVQDYEPGFTAWSSSYAAAQSTYHAGFRHVVNSTPLAAYLGEQERIAVDADLVLGPDLDTARLAAVAAARRPGPVEVFCYARPNVPRNLYATALAAAADAAFLIRRPWTLVLAGDDIAAPSVPGVTVKCLGRTDIDGYYALMSRSAVALSLMLSPHPSHPPLDWATSGGWTVTNSFGGHREGLHPRVLTAPAEPHALAQRLAEAVERPTGAYEPLPDPLGRPLPAVVESLLEVL